MRWGTEFEGIHQEAKLIFCGFFRKAQDLEHLRLKCAVKDSDRTSSDFHAVDYQIVSVSPYLTRIAVQEFDILHFR